MKYPRTIIRKGIQDTFAPLKKHGVVTDVLGPFAPISQATELGIIRVSTVNETVEAIDSDDDERVWQVAIEYHTFADENTADRMDDIGHRIEREMPFLESLATVNVTDVQLIDTQWPDTDDQTHAAMALIYQITYTTPRED
nr:hypothetical protein 21 [Pseudomonadaceae bacterium]